jgi:hypothetical protein
VEKAERDLIMRQQIVLPETPRQRRELAALAEDLKAIPQAGRPLSLRLRNFRSSAESYLASAGGPLPYMLRLREIESATGRHEASLREERRALAQQCAGDREQFTTRWRALADAWAFDDLTDLIERHNRWYPVESRLPMDPRTGEYVLVNGRDYRIEPLAANWILERFPAELSHAA